MITESDSTKLAEFAERYGEENPVVKLSEFIVLLEPEEKRPFDFWQRLAIWAEYCNEPVIAGAEKFTAPDVQKILGVSPTMMVSDDHEPTPQER